MSTTTQDRPVVLELEDVSVSIRTAGGIVRPVDHVSLQLHQGEVLGIVGETGSGKTVTCRSMLGLMPTEKADHSGAVRYPGMSEKNVLDLGRRGMRRLWGDFISMIPQNPMTSLNPLQRIGDQIAEAVTAHEKLSGAATRQRVIELMSRVGIPIPEKRRHDYPHQFSGGMLQRTLIAIALAGNPQVLIADEPTTALDVIIQDQILSLLIDLQRDIGMSLVLVSHDLSVIAQICDRVGVMYGGELVELAATQQILRSPQHPYTAALLGSLPAAVARDQPLTTITGSPPRLVDLPSTCRFLPRCTFSDSGCQTWQTALLPTGEGQVRCRRHDELDLFPVTAPVSTGRATSLPIVGVHAR